MTLVKRSLPCRYPRSNIKPKGGAVRRVLVVGVDPTGSRPVDEPANRRRPWRGRERVGPTIDKKPLVRCQLAYSVSSFLIFSTSGFTKAAPGRAERWQRRLASVSPHARLQRGSALAGAEIILHSSLSTLHSAFARFRFDSTQPSA